MNRLRRFGQLSQGEQRLFLQAAFALSVCRVRLRLHGVNRLRAWALRPGHGTRAVADLVNAVNRATHVNPASTCLARAITLQHLLSANGHGSELKIGVWKVGGQLAAHAWLVKDDVVLIGNGKELSEARVLDVWRAARPSRAETNAVSETQ